MTNEEMLQWLLVGGPILSLVATWMSLRTYGKLRQKSLDQEKFTAKIAKLAADPAPKNMSQHSGEQV